VTYGGQAALDGVMMRGPEGYAIARRAASGDIAVTTGSLPTWGVPLKRVPFVRGLVSLAEALPLGVTTLTPRRRWLLVAALVGLSFLPFWLGIALLGALVLVTGQRAAVVRLLGYHGAEHKTVNAVEAGAPLTVESVQRFSTRHPRCGTSFLLVFLDVSFAASQLLGSHLWTLPIVLAVATEVQRLNVLPQPGMWLQRLTTREPTDDQVEVAIAALEAVRARAKSGPTEVDPLSLVASS
jgi:uncharacterized protein YqhQ